MWHLTHKASNLHVKLDTDYEVQYQEPNFNFINNLHIKLYNFSYFDLCFSIGDPTDLIWNGNIIKMTLSPSFKTFTATDNLNKFAILREIKYHLQRFRLLKLN